MTGVHALVSCPVHTGLLLGLLHLLTVNCNPASQARSDEDAWLAVINSGSTQPQEPVPRQDTELYQFEQPEGLGGQQPAGRVEQQASERAAQQPIDIVPYGRAPQQQLIREQEQQPIERFAQEPVSHQPVAHQPVAHQPVAQQPQPQREPQPQQFQPQAPTQQHAPVPQHRVPPQQQRRPPPQQRAPVQRQRLPGGVPHRPVRPGPPRPGQGPRPGFPGNRRKPTKPGLIGGAIGAVGGLVKDAQCAASNFITEEKMKDKDFIEFQLNCALERGPCDDIGNKIKILAPEVLAGRCPPPCTECTRKQIRRVMTELSQKFPRKFQEMMGKLRG